MTQLLFASAKLRVRLLNSLLSACLPIIFLVLAGHPVYSGDLDVTRDFLERQSKGLMEQYFDPEKFRAGFAGGYNDFRSRSFMNFFDVMNAHDAVIKSFETRVSEIEEILDELEDVETTEDQRKLVRRYVGKSYNAARNIGSAVAIADMLRFGPPLNFPQQNAWNQSANRFFGPYEELIRLHSEIETSTTE